MTRLARQCYTDCGVANVLCPSCGKENLDTTSQCWGCGDNLAERGLTRPGLSWQWVFQGCLIVAGAVFIADALGLTLYAVVGAPVQNLLMWLPLLGFLMGGVFAARFSPGTTLAEPAIAAAIAVLFRLAQQFASKEIGAGQVIVAVVLSFGLALLGAWIGEKWQGTL